MPRAVRILGLAALGLAAACTSDPHKLIVGRWGELHDSTASWAFAENGSLTMKAEGQLFDGTYSFVDAHHVQLSVNGPFGVKAPLPLVTMDIRRNEIIMTSRGLDDTLRRLRD